MKDYFKNKLSSILLGEYENGKKIKNGEVTTNEFRNFAQRYYEAFYKDKEGVVDANKVNESMRQLDVDLSEWENAKKAGKDAVMGLDGNKQEGNAGRNLDYFVEEFGAYYFTQMMKGKPLDYLFRGGKIEGVRGAMYALKNSFLDFFESRASYQNPESKERFKFENGKLIDTSFGEASAETRVETGKGGKRVRIGAIDYLMEDLVRATASQRSTFNSTGNYIDIKTWTPEARQAFFEGRGADGLKLQYDKNGQRVSEAEEKLLREEHGRKIFESLKALDQSLVKDGTISGTLSETHIEHLVNSGLISRELGDRILHIQEIVSNENVSNVLTHDYHGITKEKSTDVENPERFRGNEVPVTSRESIVFGFEFYIDEKGKTKLIAHSLDKKVIDSRANQQWSNPEVRALFGENREAFDKAFIQYIENASKDASDKTRVESALLPLLEVGDGKGALRRNVMHQVAGFKKKKNSSYFNTPLEEIKRNARSSVQSLRIDLMSNVKVESTTRFSYNDPNAFSDLSRNFKPSDMKSEETLNGTIYKHQSGSSALKTEEGLYNVYDSNNKLISKVKTEEEVASVLERNFNKEKLESDKNIKTGIDIQRKKQANFKVIDSETRAEAEKSGSIFNTQWGREFTSGTKVIPQTREDIKSIVKELIQKNQLSYSGIRMIIAGGDAPDGYTIEHPHLIIIQAPLAEPTINLPETGIKLATYAYQRQIPDVKTTDYLMAVWLQPWMKEQGADDILYYYNDIVSECPRSNFFLVTKDHTLITAQQNMLNGITRKNIIKVCEAHSIPFEIRDIQLNELKEAKEAFITSSTKRIIPVQQIDEIVYKSDYASSLARNIYDLLVELEH
jgi:D-alanine transaminase/branched-chain amino acid aminotransferase